MSTQARSQAEHYQESERLLAAAPEEPGGALLAALVHALLAQTPRRNARRADHRPTGQLPPSLSWGDEQ
jgi:hypothetical protein